MFNIGQRPAIDSGLSVSRVGSSAQYKCMKQVSSSLKIELANFHELQSFSQFGSDLDAATKKILTHGKALMELLKQHQYQVASFTRQVVELFAAKQGYIDDISLDKVHDFLEQLYLFIDKNHHQIIKEIETKKELSNKLIDLLDSKIKEFHLAYK